MRITLHIYVHAGFWGCALIGVAGQPADGLHARDAGELAHDATAGVTHASPANERPGVAGHGLSLRAGLARPIGPQNLAQPIGPADFASAAAPQEVAGPAPAATGPGVAAAGPVSAAAGLDGDAVQRLPLGREIPRVCGTHEAYVARRGTARSTAAGACPLEGSCDDPAVRDTYIDDPDPKLVRVHLLVFRESNGSNPAATAEVIETRMQVMNSDFAPYHIQFTHTWEYVDDSVYRRLNTTQEFFDVKDLYAAAPGLQCNIYVLDLPGGLAGVGTFPWTEEALGPQGGILIDEAAFEPPGDHTLTHEMGHNLGLWHTHHGVSEVSPCSACWERADGMDGDLTGDFCSDTPPTPVNFNCLHPVSIDACSGTPWGRTQPENYMSYSNCHSLFTPQQSGRMHCWSEHVLSSWSSCAPELDCNANGVHDYCDLGSGTSVDDNGNGVPDECDGPGVYVGPPGGRWLEPAHWWGGILPDDTIAVTLHTAVVLDGTGAAAASVRILPEGALHLDAGALSAGHIQVDAGGELAGSGVILGDVHNAGLITPGDPIGGLSIHGEYKQSAAGELVLDLAGPASGTHHDVLAVSGAAVLHGVLRVRLHGGFEPAAGQHFDALTFASAEGTFDIRQLPEPPPGVDLVAEFLSGAMRINALEDTSIAACQLQRVRAFDPAALDGFGTSVDIDGNRAIVGSWGDDDLGTNSGAAYVFRRDGAGWVQEAKLTPPEPSPGDRFGYSAGLSGDAAVIGAYLDFDHIDAAASGSVYVFRRDPSTASWEFEAKLLVDGGSPDDYFGYSVAISGDTIVAGAPNHVVEHSGTGYAAVFRREAGIWRQTAVLVPPEAEVNDVVGWSVDLDQHRAIIAAPGASNQRGAAYVFEFDGVRWDAGYKLQAFDGQAGHTFGYACAMHGNLAIVSAIQDNTAGTFAGSAYLFRKSPGGWFQEAKLLPADLIPGDRFGFSADVYGDTAVIGTIGDSDDGAFAGSVRVFRNTGLAWDEDPKLRADDGHLDARLGYAVALSDDTAIAGAATDDDFGVDAGSAYLFSGLSGADCNANAAADGCDLLEGTSLDLDGDATPDECCSGCAPQACCLTDESCAELEPVACMDQGGTPQGAGQSCAADPCSAPKGACCRPNGCHLTPASHCSGLYLGDHTVCDHDACPQPTGACCFGEACQRTSIEACLASGGQYQADGVACGETICIPPAGACCIEGVCTENVDREVCVDDYGAYRGHGETCTFQVCPSVFMIAAGEDAAAAADVLTLSAGDTVSVEVWMQDLAPSLLNAYQVIVRATAAGDTPSCGSVGYQSGSAWVDISRDDWVFTGFPSIATYIAESDEGFGYIVTSPAGLFSPVQLAYTAEFLLRASPDAAGTFQLELVPLNHAPYGGTGLVDENYDAIAPEVRPLTIHVVPGPGDPDCNANGIADACEPDCDQNGIPDDCEPLPGDMNLDGTVDMHDVQCVLNGYGGTRDACSSDPDLAPCEGDSVVGVYDMLAILDALHGGNPCCPGATALGAEPDVDPRRGSMLRTDWQPGDNERGSRAPAGTGGIGQAENFQLELRPSARRLVGAKGGYFDVFAHGGGDLRAYELFFDLNATAELAGLQLQIDPHRDDYLFFGNTSPAKEVHASNPAELRQAAALTEGSASLIRPAYLGRVYFKLHPGAEGTITLSLRPETVLLNHAAEPLPHDNLGSATIEIRPGP